MNARFGSGQDTSAAERLLSIPAHAAQETDHGEHT